MKMKHSDVHAAHLRDKRDSLRSQTESGLVVILGFPIPDVIRNPEGERRVSHQCPRLCSGISAASLFPRPSAPLRSEGCWEGSNSPGALTCTRHTRGCLSVCLAAPRAAESCLLTIQEKLPGMKSLGAGFKHGFTEVTVCL